MEADNTTEFQTTHAATNASTAHLRVSADKIGRLMDLVGELSLTVLEAVQSPDLEGLDLSRFENSAHRLRLVVHEVQTAAAELRLVPVGDVFKRMRRLMRELERQTGKEVDLELLGEETQIDKFIVDRLFEPLIHLLRNSVDHGLEAPEARLAAGKHRRGKVMLSAAAVGGDVQITIADDGRGLDRGRILKKARERGFIGAKDEPPDTELWRVIFLPGFSTAETVTNLSGRGVGMDVLNHTINELRGRITIQSRAGEGTTITIAIPLSLAFLDCVVVRIGSCLYAAPIDVVAEILQPNEAQVHAIFAKGNREIIQVRGASVPICRLDTGDRNRLTQHAHGRTVIVLNTSGGRIGLPIDELFDQQQVVMKPLTGHLKKIRAGIGCALLGSGEVAIVLDGEKLSDAGEA